MLKLFTGAASYHHNRRQTSGRHHDRDRYERERERDRYDRMDRERERLHARERDLMQYDLNQDELLDERGYAVDYPPAARNVPVGSGAPHPHHGHLSRSGRLMDDSDIMLDREDPRIPGARSNRTMDHRDHMPPASAPPTRRGPPLVDRDEYSPHRGSGSSRRMLNAM